jgi:hypothetical protein
MTWGPWFDGVSLQFHRSQVISALPALLALLAPLALLALQSWAVAWRRDR